MNKPRILLADDHPSVLSNLCRLADTVGEVVAAISEGRAAVTEVRGLRPDVVVLDFTMPGVGGIDAIKRIQRDLPEIRVIICTVHMGKEWVKEVFAAGAIGFVRKQTACEDLVAAIHAALAGKRFVSPSACYIEYPSGEVGN